MVEECDVIIVLTVSQWFHVMEVGLLLVLCLIILFSSLVIIAAVFGCKKLHSIPGFLMVGLGVCDIFIALGSMAPSIAAEIMGKWVFGDAICACQVFATTYFSSLESCFIMLCAVDKGLAIAKPLSYAQFRHIYKRLFLGMVLGIICFNLPIPFLMIFLSQKVHYVQNLAACAAKLPDSLWFIPGLGYIMQFCVPGFVIIVCYVFIGYKAVQSKRANQRRQRQATNSRCSTIAVTQIRTPQSEGSSKNSDPNTNSTTTPKPGSNTKTTRFGTTSQILTCSSTPGSPSHHVKISNSSNKRGSVNLDSTRNSTANDYNNSAAAVHSSSLSSFLQHLKMCKMLLVIAIVYFVSFLPIFVYQFMAWCQLVSFNMYHYKMINIMQYFNGVIDGVVFYSMSQTFKDQVNMMFGRKRRPASHWKTCTTTPMATRANCKNSRSVSEMNGGATTKLLPASTIYSDRLQVPRFSCAMQHHTQQNNSESTEL